MGRDTVTNINDLITQVNMDRCGVHWFKFDEPSGDKVYDSKGNAEGTIYGGVTRVDGVDGGKALQFNGVNGYVQFNQKCIPIGKKSIKFRMKATKTSLVKIILHTANSGGIGDQIHISNVEGLKHLIRTPNGVIDGIQYYNDDLYGNYHTYLFTQESIGTSTHAKIYVGNINSEVVSLYDNKVQSGTATYNMLIGARFTGSTRDLFFDGILDNLEIYNDIYQPYVNLQLIRQGDDVYAFENGVWTNIGTLPTDEQQQKQMFLDHPNYSLKGEDIKLLKDSLLDKKFTMLNSKFFYQN